MNKKFTTSAQKTLRLSKDVILEKLEDELTADRTLCFQPTKRVNIKQAKLQDGSKVVIAAFDKGDGKTLAMIDYKDLPENENRAVIQRCLRQTLDKLFKSS